MSLASQDEKLVYMVNQIATFFAHEPDQVAVEEITTHLRKFWEKRMREKIVALAATGPHGMLPSAFAAVRNLTSCENKA